MPRVYTVVLLIESSRGSGRRLLKGIADYARHHGPWAFYWEPRGLERAWAHLTHLDPDGIILRDVDAVDEVLSLRLPAVVIGHSRKAIPGLVNVVTESEAIGRLGAEHLLRAGLRHFAFCGFADKPWSRLRGESFRRRLAMVGFPTHLFEAPQPLTTRSWKGELAAMIRWLRSLPKPAGLMACNDDRGQQVLTAASIAGLRVPDELAVIGADNDELVCDLSDPPMSSVSINFERAGYEGARALHQLMAGRRNPRRGILVHSTHVVARQSTDILLVPDPAAAKALRFIRQHAQEHLRVNDVARAAGVSRRILESRFRTTLGRSVLEEIRRWRVDRISRMLVETNQSVSQIALALGYGGVEHIARYFRRETGMTPLAYRRRYGQQ
ncbi:MAG: DNA-binding transcriptional regulator [Verrucomicrobia bacterium]|nr:DNA-binding transcriptional regulator [Verrucomicrobiota bacterium]